MTDLLYLIREAMGRPLSVYILARDQILALCPLVVVRWRKSSTR